MRNFRKQNLLYYGALRVLRIIINLPVANATTTFWFQRLVHRIIRVCKDIKLVVARGPWNRGIPRLKLLGLF